MEKNPNNKTPIRPHREFFLLNHFSFAMKKQCIIGQVKLKIYYFMEVSKLVGALPIKFFPIKLFHKQYQSCFLSFPSPS